MIRRADCRICDLCIVQTALDKAFNSKKYSFMPTDMTTSQNFVFEDSDLTPEIAQNHVDEVMSHAEDGELFIERSASEALTFDDGRLRNASFDTSRGFGLRCVAGETSGFAQGTELTPAALSRAASAVVMAKNGYDGTLAPSPKRTNVRLYPNIDPIACLLYTSPSPRDQRGSRMPSSA